jgi:hypothetical protein
LAAAIERRHEVARSGFAPLLLVRVVSAENGVGSHALAPLSFDPEKRQDTTGLDVRP